MTAAAPAVAKSVEALRAVVRNCKLQIANSKTEGGGEPRLGFVPTMGFLHEGHASLIRRARLECDVLVVSVFVNPTQFGPGEDFASYPRDLDRDLAMLAREHADVAFVPETAEFYPPGAATAVVVGGAAEPLEGAHRPGHFRGVATVVAMLFNAVQPHVAYFGEKDWQQLQVVRRLVRDLHLPLEVVAVPTTRERDGLAMSSRNVRLGEAERVQALCVPHALDAARSAYAAGERSPRVLERAMADVIAREPAVKPDYAVVVDAETLQPIDRATDQSRALIAARVGAVRLIDNCALAAG